MRSRGLKLTLVSVMVVGALGFVTVQRTYAVFSTEADNPSSSVASGTLTFDNTVNGGTACFTDAGLSSPGNVNNNCDALFSYSPSVENYPGSPVTARVKIVNDGSLNATDLSLYMPSCTQGATGDAPNPGGGNPCASGGAQFYVQETASDWTTPIKCWFPSGTSCSFVSNALYVFAQNFRTSAGALDLGSGPQAMQARYFVIGIQLPSNAANNLQGEEAIFPLTWHMTS